MKVHVKYFTQGSERIFDRPNQQSSDVMCPCVIHQQVFMSLKKSLKVLDQVKKIMKDFWIRMKDIVCLY